MKRSEIEKLEKTIGRMEGLHAEIIALAKKSPNDGVNKVKLGFINKAIEEALQVLGSKYQPFDDFEKFDADELPTNSDVSFILTQFLEELERKRADNIEVRAGGRWVYSVDDGGSEIRTGPPRKIGKK